MTVSVVFAIAGVIALLFGIIGGGIKAREVEIPPLPLAVRIITILLGLVFLGTTVFLEYRGIIPVTGTQIPTLPTIPSPESTSPIEPTATVSPTDTPAPTDTSTPPADPSGSEALIAKLITAKTWNLVLQEPFDNNDNNWTLWNHDNDQRTISTQIDRGVLSMRMQAKAASQHWEIAPLSTYANFYYAVKAKRIGSPSAGVNQAVWGIIFRRQGDNFYALLLNDVQEYTLYLHQGTEWTSLLGPIKSDLISVNRSNELAVVADGDQIAFYINGNAVNSIEDSTLSDGNVGISVGAYSQGDDVTIEFDDFELRQKP